MSPNSDAGKPVLTALSLIPRESAQPYKLADLDTEHAERGDSDDSLNKGGEPKGEGNYVDDGIVRTGNVLSVFFLIITAVIGSGILSVGAALAMLGWVAGLIILILFGFITWGMAILMAKVHVVDGVRHHTYRQLVYHILGRNYTIGLAIIQQINVFLTAVAYYIAGASSLRKIAVSICEMQDSQDCFDTYWHWALIFAATQVFLSQVPDLHHFAFLALAGSLASFAYSFIAIGLGFGHAKAGNGSVQGVPESHANKGFGILNALGSMAFCYGFFMVIVEINDTIRDKPSVGITRPMRRSLAISFPVMIGLYTLVAVSGYLAFGDELTGNIITMYTNPHWVIIMANVGVLIHMLVAPILYLTPIFQWESLYVEWERRPLPPWVFRLVYRTLIILAVTIIAVCLPFFGSFAGLVGAIGFWPTTVFLPTLVYMKVFKPTGIKYWGLQVNQVFCFLVSLGAVIGSIQSIVVEAKDYTPFQRN